MAVSTPLLRRKKPSGVRPELVMNSRSRSSTSLVMSFALSASVLATRRVDARPLHRDAAAPPVCQRARPGCAGLIAFGPEVRGLGLP